MKWAKWAKSYLWYIMGTLAIALALMATFCLRQNNLNMAKLRDQLAQADETGEVAQVQSAARKLQNYVAHHMNTTTGKLALQTLYNQAAEQAMEESRPPEIDTTLYNQATNDCRPQLTNYGYRAWASCVATKVGINATASYVTAESVAPDPDLYYVEYVPARWSFDLAGISLLFFIVVMAAITARLVIWACHKLVHIYKKSRTKTV
ncbi:MAG: hypothetical protein Q4C83_01405 [Candidatus Saccharibacteria bacterium]|nr:hypothetical protein [Candidatus Saccharibacteria bacterium]